MCGPTRRGLTTTGAALLLGVVLLGGGHSLAPLVMERPDDRMRGEVRTTQAVYRHVASYATGPVRSQEIFTTAERTDDE